MSELPSTCSSAIESGVAAAQRATACGARQVGSSTSYVIYDFMDLDPTDEQRSIVDMFGSLADRTCPLDQLRDHEPRGFSTKLWEQLVAVGAPGMAVTETAGGAGATLLDLALAVEALGRRLAPAPLVEHAVAARLLARGAALPDGMIDGAHRRPPSTRPCHWRVWLGSARGSVRLCFFRIES